ncbi:hypothetical protein SF1_42320 [Sphingobacterium faecium NBRC 15299]|uniref:DUF3226 domain-containing protein n=1 Tax=Sphingobacterium faecium TaxID=34087 RepID=UPI0011934488|nr:DUF3226 domain-containing protein [Sphingobacterium faecium]GEM66250.1 hypothetical protein SF1_42320 [Sphingobacterium faecium NBRC 15299]
MANKIIFALCEGPHDAAFIYRVLKASGYESYEKVSIKDLPFPVNSLITTEANKSNVEDLNIQTIKQSFIPNNSLKKGDKYIFLFVLGGITQFDKISNFINKVKAFIPEEGKITTGRITDDTEINISLFFDADEDGVNNRLNMVNRNLNGSINSKIDLFTQNSMNVNVQGIGLGVHIVTGQNDNTGKLEDILVPLMKLDNELIFESAEKFLTDHFADNRLYNLRIIKDDNGMKMEERSTKLKYKLKYDKQKSLVATVGQLQKSGGANTTCISQTDYLTMNKIIDNHKCQEIIGFIDGV